MAPNESFDLDRFVSAQDAGGSYDRALAELSRGQKTGHWIWYVFPQMAGLGSSPTSVHFAIGGLPEARAYLGHTVLGPRLLTCARVVADTEGRTAEQIFGGLDAMKLRSSMTLFHRADPAEPLFRQVLERFFGGSPDPATDAILASQHP